MITKLKYVADSRKLIEIKQHIRQVEGKTETVKRHKRLQEVSDKPKDDAVTSQIDVADLNSQIDRAENLNSFIIKDSEFQDLYKEGFNAIYDKFITNSGTDYEKSFNEMLYEFDQSELGKLFSQGGANGIKHELIKPEYLTGLKEKTDTIQRYFEDHLVDPENIKRVTPFTFVFKHGIEAPLPNHAETLLMGSLQALKDSETFAYTEQIYKHIESKSNLSDHASKIYKTSDMIAKYMKQNPNINQKKMVEIYIPIQTERINGRYFNNIMSEKFGMKPIDRQARNLIGKYIADKAGSPDKLPEWAMTISDPEVVRKELKGVLSSDKNALAELKLLKPQDVFSFMDNAQTFGRVANQNFFTKYNDKIKKQISEPIIKANESYKQMEETNKFMVVSKNPFEFLTMSPGGNFESCQSLYDDEGASGCILNANMMNIRHLDKNHDFIMYMAKETKNGTEKTTRTSLTLNPEDPQNGKMYHFENGRIYGSSTSGKELLKNQMNISRSKIEHKDGYNDTLDLDRIMDGITNNQVSDSIEKHLPNLREMNNKIEGNENLDELEQMADELKDLRSSFVGSESPEYKITKEVRQKHVKQVNDRLKSGDSMHYNSGLHGFISAGGARSLRSNVENKSMLYQMNLDRIRGEIHTQIAYLKYHKPK